MTKFTKWKKWQKLIQGLYPNHVHISRPRQKHVQSFIKIGIKNVWGVAHTRYPLSLDFHRIWGQKMTKFTKWKKWQKLIQGLYLNHMHISRPWRKHVQSFKKISIKLCEELRSQGTHCHNIIIESEVRKCWRTNKRTETCTPKSPMLKQVRQKVNGSISAIFLIYVENGTICGTETATVTGCFAPRVHAEYIWHLVVLQT